MGFSFLMFLLIKETFVGIVQKDIRTSKHNRKYTKFYNKCAKGEEKKNLCRYTFWKHMQNSPYTLEQICFALLLNLSH